jgi:hypothetical protein
MIREIWEQFPDDSNGIGAVTKDTRERETADKGFCSCGSSWYRLCGYRSSLQWSQ